nr:hypothetical protein MACL_00002759 [Theileria orientalis]
METFSLESHGIYCTKFFRNVGSRKLGEMFVRWMKREADEMVPFGRPKTEMEFSYLSEASGDKLIFLGLDYDEYMKVVIKTSEEDANSSELVLINGPKTNILKGSYGRDLKDRLVKSINALVSCFENDVNKLLTLMSTSKVKSEYDYSGSNAVLSVSNLEDYVNYHKKLDEIMKGKRIDLSQSEEVKNELSKAKADEKASTDMSIAKLAEAISVTERKKPKEQIKTIVSNLKKNLSLDEMQMEDLFKNAMERLNRQVEEKKQREEEISKSKSTDTWFESQMEPKTIIDKAEDPFYAIMNNPANMETSLLVRKYHSISKTQQEKLRERWNNNAKRLNLLVNELFEATPDVLSTICNNYRDLLISEDYPTIMRSYIVNNGIRSEREKERLRYLNEFVLSIYKDAEIYTLKDEQYQLAKIKQICDWAINDFENINDLVEANKNQYDVHFMSYIKLLIRKESEMFEKSGVSMRPENNPWLSILTIIQIAIRSMMEADIAEDLNLITNIVHMKMPKVRTHMTEFILATMPRSEWKSFKKLVFTLTDALTNKGTEEGNMTNIPEYVPEACHQLRREVESMIPDWIIEELLSENDKKLMMENNEEVTWDCRREKYNIDKNLLSQKHKQYQFMLHPDKHANKSPDELDLITSNSSLVNTYYSTLLDDKKRAKCLFVMKYGKEKFEKMISKRVEDQLEQIMEVSVKRINKRAQAHEKVESLGSEEERKELKEEFEKKIEDSVNKIGMSFENEVNTKTNKRVQEPDSIIDNYRYLSFYRQIYEKLK